MRRISLQGRHLRHILGQMRNFGCNSLRRNVLAPTTNSERRKHLRGHVELLRCYYNFIRPHRALKFGRQTRTPAMQAGVVSVPMNWSDIFTSPASLYVFLVAVVRVPIAVHLMETSAAALSTLSWMHEHRSAA